MVVSLCVTRSTPRSGQRELSPSHQTSVHVCVLEGKGQSVFILELNSYDSQSFQLFHASSDLSLHLENELGANRFVTRRPSVPEQLWWPCTEVRSHHRASAMGKQHNFIILTPPWLLRPQPGVSSISSSLGRERIDHDFPFSPFFLLAAGKTVQSALCTHNMKLQTHLL